MIKQQPAASRQAVFVIAKAASTSGQARCLYGIARSWG